MNAQITKLFTLMSNLDSYSQLSVFGSWNFMINSACISNAMRYVPDEPVDNGIEHFTEYEAARRALMKDADNSQLPALLALQRDITGAIYEADGQGRGLDDTLEFLTQDAPKRATFEEEYERRRRQGLRPAMPKKVFVDYEYERAVNQFNQLVSRGEHAVRLCETFTLEGMDADDVPDWVPESMEAKLIEKLHGRWEKLEFVRSNPRRKKQIRDAAAADQMMIAKVLATFGETPGFGDDMDDNDDAVERDAFGAEAGDLTTLDPKAPGKVRILTPEEYASQA